MVATKDQKASTAAAMIYENWILKFGAPSQILSDRGSSFLNELFQTFLHMDGMNIRHVKTSPYHAQCNGLTENMNKSIIIVIRAHCHDKDNWPDYLSTISSGLNNTVNTALQVSPYFVLFGIEFRSPLDILMSDTDQQTARSDNNLAGLQDLAEKMRILREVIHSNVSAARRYIEENRNQTATTPTFTLGQRVFLDNRFDSRQVKNRKHGTRFLARSFWYPNAVKTSFVSSILRQAAFCAIGLI